MADSTREFEIYLYFCIGLCKTAKYARAIPMADRDARLSAVGALR